ncbi:MAG: folylpolyglutamate synthase/dihydrofolate synthase family protein [Candidatus Cloacimonadota bacterium]|nr:folylpolyglutamate synthase/dihydrofolate synthase family protein [Candidatus Cloacimonadota bacterium]
MEYQEFLDYIYQRHSGNVKLGLERMQNILRAMDSPNEKLHGIHIAGTNGKGSTAAMCEALSLQYDIKTGLNTSPHLVDYRERIRLNGKNIDLDELISTYKKWENVLEENEASFFEITTAMAFDIFHSNNIDNAIFEVGLGGRLDGTNPFESTVTVITTISYDHTKSLGNSIEKIAFEKAGIIKTNTPVVLGKIPAEAIKVIRQRAKELNAPVLEYGKDFSISNIEINDSGTSFNYHSPKLDLENVVVNLLGKHQAYNASIAIIAFIIFLQKTGRIFDKQKIYKALTHVNWQGRMQIISQNPTVIIDGAHNEEGIKALRNNLLDLFPNKKIYFVLAILRDKKLETIIKDICSVSHKIYITKNKSNRAAEIEDQVEFVKLYNEPYEVHEDVITAVKKAISDADKDDIVMISGSLYTISEVIKEKPQLINNRFN